MPRIWALEYCSSTWEASISSFIFQLIVREPELSGASTLFLTTCMVMVLAPWVASRWVAS